MIFDDPVFLEEQTHPQFERLREQYWYLKGVLLSDEQFRLDKQFNPKLVDPFGGGTPAFWRGVLESAGSIRMDAAGGREYKHPHVGLKGSYAFLMAFLAFLEEALRPQAPGSPGGWQVKFDDDGKLAFQAGGGSIQVRGPKAQEIVRLLYLGATVGRVSPGFIADAIHVWSSSKRR